MSAACSGRIVQAWRCASSTSTRASVSIGSPIECDVDILPIRTDWGHTEQLSADGAALIRIGTKGSRHDHQYPHPPYRIRRRGRRLNDCVERMRWQQLVLRVGFRQRFHRTLPSISADASLAAGVPRPSSTGKLQFGTDASYAPMEFIAEDGSTIVGADIDLGNAIAAKLGLQGEWANSNFDALIVGVTNGKFNASMSSFTINAEREKQVNMVSYLSAGTSWAVQTGNPAGVNPKGSLRQERRRAEGDRAGRRHRRPQQGLHRRRQA